MAKAQQKNLHFVENFGLSGAAAIISKTAAAPIERVKLLVQNQDEMIKAGRLDTPYKGVLDCTARTYKAEGFASFWRGKYCSVSSVTYLKKLTCWKLYMAALEYWCHSSQTHIITCNLVQSKNIKANMKQKSSKQNAG